MGGSTQSFGYVPEEWGIGEKPSSPPSGHPVSPLLAQPAVKQVALPGRLLREAGERKVWVDVEGCGVEVSGMHLRKTVVGGLGFGALLVLQECWSPHKIHVNHPPGAWKGIDKAILPASKATSLGPRPRAKSEA